MFRCENGGHNYWGATLMSHKDTMLNVKKAPSGSIHDVEVW